VTVLQPVTIDRCPLCQSSVATEHSTPEPNLYSEKLSEILRHDEPVPISVVVRSRCLY
jgi:hypothetical protein